MKRLLCLIFVLGGLAPPARAFVDASPTLGRLVNDSSTIVILEVQKVQKEKRLILFKKVADLKGQTSAGPVKPAFARNFASTASRFGGRREPPKTSST